MSWWRISNSVSHEKKKRAFHLWKKYLPFSPFSFSEYLHSPYWHFVSWMQGPVTHVSVAWGSQPTVFLLMPISCHALWSRSRSKYQGSQFCLSLTTLWSVLLRVKPVNKMGCLFVGLGQSTPLNLFCFKREQVSYPLLTSCKLQQFGILFWKLHVCSGFWHYGAQFISLMLTESDTILYKMF